MRLAVALLLALPLVIGHGYKATIMMKTKYAACSGVTECNAYKANSAFVEPVVGLSSTLQVRLYNYDTATYVSWGLLKLMQSGRRLSVVVVGRDMTVFARLHPEDFGTPQQSDTSFAINFTFPKSGTYLMNVAFRLACTDRCGGTDVTQNPYVDPYIPGLEAYAYELFASVKGGVPMRGAHFRTSDISMTSRGSELPTDQAYTGAMLPSTCATTSTCGTSYTVKGKHPSPFYLPAGCSAVTLTVSSTSGSDAMLSPFLHSAADVVFARHGCDEQTKASGAKLKCAIRARGVTTRLTSANVFTNISSSVCTAAGNVTATGTFGPTVVVYAQLGKGKWQMFGQLSVNGVGGGVMVPFSYSMEVGGTPPVAPTEEGGGDNHQRSTLIIVISLAAACAALCITIAIVRTCLQKSYGSAESRKRGDGGEAFEMFDDAEKGKPSSRNSVGYPPSPLGAAGKQMQVTTAGGMPHTKEDT